MISNILAGTVTPIMHRYFARFGRGDFEGPKLTATARGNTLTIKGDFDFLLDAEKLLFLTAPHEEFTLKGSIVTFSAFAKEVSDILSQWRLKPDTKFMLTLSRKETEKLFNAIQEKAFLLATIKGKGTTYQLKSKSSLPKPDKMYIKPFFTAKFENSDDVKLKLKHLLYPFAEKSLKRKLSIEITYVIESMEDPGGTEPLRIRLIRKGYMDYTVIIDDEEIKKKIPFSI